MYIKDKKELITNMMQRKHVLKTLHYINVKYFYCRKVAIFFFLIISVKIL